MTGALNWLLWGFGIAFVLALFPLSWLYLRGMFRKDRTFDLRGTPPNTPGFLLTLASLSDSHLTSGEPIRFFADIEELQKERIRAIAEAKESIQFETFLMSPGSRTRDFAKALEERARQGVKVQLLADSYGAKDLPEEYWQSLREAGVEVEFFNPFSWRSPIDSIRRNHRKLLIIDQTTALIGGAGISGFWDGEVPPTAQEPWFDFEVHWQGEAVGWLTGLFWQHWLSAGGTVDLQQHQPRQSAEHDHGPLLITSGEDPTPDNSPIRSLFQTCSISAQKRIWIASPYLLPDQFTCEILAQACKRGVDVRVLTMGPCSDKDYVYYTSRQHYGPLLKSGIKLYEYQPSMMHAKVILIDEELACMGSANLDPRSFFHNDELNVCSPNSSLIVNIETFFERGFSRSKLIEFRRWKRRPLKHKVIGSICDLAYWQL
ncbi:MAG: phospholipase D-like domain-containing protein [Limnothrix sp.]